MRTLAILRRNLRKLFKRLSATLWPPNLAVVLRNAFDLTKHEPWAKGERPSQGRRLDDLSSRSLAWISRSQDKLGSGGVGSYVFSGWETTGYPEVTGYIIPTIWDYAARTGREELRARAIRMAEWELRTQRANGGWEGGAEGEGFPPLVFNTGQVMRGLLRTFEETGDHRYLDAARRAGDWIVDVQEPDGSWTTSNHLGLKRTYDSYVAAPLSHLSLLDGDERHAEAARKNCNFVLEHQRDNGWFELCDNSAEFVANPVTHTIGYTADGLIETGELLGEDAYVEAGACTAAALADLAEPSGYLAGRFDESWRPTVRWVCLTGSAQSGIILMRVFQRTRTLRYLTVAERILDFLFHVERLNGIGRDRRGGMAGSYPIWGPYAFLRYPSWATKYYLDLLLMVQKARDSRSTAELASTSVALDAGVSPRQPPPFGS